MRQGFPIDQGIILWVSAIKRGDYILFGGDPRFSFHLIGEQGIYEGCEISLGL
jgi:hypothetical protein